MLGGNYQGQNMTTCMHGCTHACMYAHTRMHIRTHAHTPINKIIKMNQSQGMFMSEQSCRDLNHPHNHTPLSLEWPRSSFQWPFSTPTWSRLLIKVSVRSSSSSLS